MFKQTPPIVRYRLDPGKSTFTVQAFATGLLAGFGHNPIIGIQDFSGEVSFIPETFAQAAMRLVIKTKALTALQLVIKTRSQVVPRPPDPKTLRDIERIMIYDMLEAQRYPEIVFQSTEVKVTRIMPSRYKAQITGALTCHGITHSAPWVMAQVILDDFSLRAQGDFRLRQSNYKLKPVSVAGGTLKLEDELVCNFALLGRRV